MRLSEGDPLARSLVAAIRRGEIESLKGLLREHPGLASARVVDGNGGSRTPLRVVTDWPGFFPHGPEVVGALIPGGAPLDDAVG